MKKHQFTQRSHWVGAHFALISVAAIALAAAQDDSPLRYYKGNTHTHSLWSDGNDFPEMIVSWYQEQGYDFLALSDHNILSRGERWMEVSKVEARRRVKTESTLAKYLAKFGEDWVERRGEGEKQEVRLKGLAEFRPRFEKDGSFLLIEAEEISDRYEKHHIHINAVNLSEAIEPQRGDSVRETIRNNLRAVEVDAKVFGKPVLAHINHPNFHYSLTAEDLAHVLEARFFEVYNGHPGINHLGKAGHPGDEQLWDIANTIRVGELKAPPLFGLATDDSHTYHGGDVSPGRGWVMVRAAKLEADELVHALKRGDFYASSGVVLNKVTWQAGSRTHSLEIEPVDGVTFETRFIGTRRSSPDKPGEVLATVKGTTASYTMQPEDLYVRATVTSSQAHPNPSFEGQKKQAWTQPVGW